MPQAPHARRRHSRATPQRSNRPPVRTPASAEVTVILADKFYVSTRQSTFRHYNI